MKFSWTTFFLTVSFSQVVYPQGSLHTFWFQVTDSTAYSPRDSSPNASVVHDGSVWILAGWRNDNDTLWHSESDVWRSDDAIHWESVNEDPPYLPYSAFISFKGFIWTFGGTSFRSSDGVTWDTVETNLYISYGSKAVVFQNEIWITDGTSVFRSEDGYKWEIMVENAPWEYRTWPGFLVFKNKLWFFGGGINYMTGEDFYFNDVWSSSDGINWVREIQNAAWPGRYWFGFQVYDNKMWLMGGWDYYAFENETRGNRNDTWYTENGVDWFPLPTDNIWPERHAHFVWVFDNAMWISSGYGGLGKTTLYNDIWKLTDVWKDAKIEQSIDVVDTITYGMSLPSDLEASSALPVQTEIVQGPQSDDGLVIPGQYTIRLTNEGNSIFGPLNEERTIVVQKKDLIVSLPDYNKYFGSPNPKFDLNFDGFVYEDDKTSIEELPTPLTIATLYSPEGTYDVVPEGGRSSRYNFVRRSGSLHVRADDLEILYSPNPVATKLTVYASSPHARIQIISSLGQIILDESTSEASFTVDMSAVASGIYFLRVTGPRKSRTIRIVKR